MSHILCLFSERTSIQLGEAKGAETVTFHYDLHVILADFVPQTGSNNYLRSNIRRFQFVLGLVLQRFMDSGTISPALRMFRSRRNVLSPGTLCRTTRDPLG